MITGVDVPISLLRDDFAASLWLNTTNRIFYARAFRNEKFIGDSLELIPEVFTTGKEYKEVLFNDKFNVLVFFDVADTVTDVMDIPETTISAIFAVNLKEVHPTIAYRAEEEVHAEVFKVIEQRRSPVSISEIEITTGLNAYGDFFRDNVKGFNMQPYHVFRFDMTVKFYYDCDDNFNNTLRVPGFTYPDPIIF